MKFYKCDMCGKVFEPDEGMIKGWYSGSRKIRWAGIGCSSVEELKIKKTIKVYKEIPATEQLPPHKVEVSLDICRPCLVNFERP